MMTRIKTKQEIEYIRTSGAMLASVLELLTKKITIGMTTLDLDKLAAEEVAKLGGKPAFKGYNGFPATLCVSVNDAVVHGIPGAYELQQGDIVSFDFGVNFNGMITDAARTVVLKGAKQEALKLVDVTKESLDAGIKAVKNGCHVGDISAAVQAVLEREHLGIVKELVGHGVGHELHEDPNIPNYGRAGTGPKLLAGMTIAIEPMATLGGWRVYIDRDGWTVRTYDQSLSAHFEDTVLITDKGYEILTR